MRDREQMPTVAFVLEKEYHVKLEERVHKLHTTKSDYLRKIVKAVLDVEVDENV